MEAISSLFTIHLLPGQHGNTTIHAQMSTCFAMPLATTPATTKAAPTPTIFKGKSNTRTRLWIMSLIIARRWNEIAFKFPSRCNNQMYCPDNGSQCTQLVPVGGHCELVSFSVDAAQSNAHPQTAKRRRVCRKRVHLPEFHMFHQRSTFRR